MMGVLLSITVGGLCLGAAVIARHRAQAAADLASLAAAGGLADGAESACARASAVARAMNTVVTQCVLDQLDVTVTVQVPVAFGRIGIGTARAAARAGPADPPD